MKRKKQLVFFFFLKVKPLLSSLVSPLQTAFIESKRGADNVVKAQELVYSLNQKKRRGEGFVIFKIDLEKAHHRLEWSFVRAVFTNVSFCPETIELILSCITTSPIPLPFYLMVEDWILFCH